MLNPHEVVADPERIKASLTARGVPDLHAAVDRIVALADQRSQHIQERDTLRSQRNTVSKQIGQLMRAGQRDQAQALKQSLAQGAARIPVIEQALAALEAERTELLMQLPNTLAPDTPPGTAESDNPVERTWGTLPAFDFEPQPHVELGTKLGILDLERAAKLSGARFYVLRGPGARLERALINYYLDLHTTEHGYTEVMTPYVVHRRMLEGTGQLPKFESDLFKIEGKLNGSDAFLIPTAEVPVTNLHRDEIVDHDQLPIKYACFTPCFRSEAGSAGRDVRGLIRVHQFHKVELVWVTTPERSEADHHALVSHAERCLQQLELPYRVVRHCAGEVSFSATKAYDLEVWLPSQQQYREISSVSHYGDYQARRMALRFRPPPTAERSKPKPRLAHTLNGSGLAIGRTVVAILENYQQADGSVRVPQVLVPYMGGVRVLT